MLHKIVEADRFRPIVVFITFILHLALTIMKLQGSLTAAVGVLSLVQGTHAWGSMGHETIAYIAQNFVSTATKKYCQKILKDTTTSYLANVATWADTYRYTSAGAFSRPYHFIDAQDSPPESCGADYNRDCGGGCVVSAINNYVHAYFSKQYLDVTNLLHRPTLSSAAAISTP
jgi:hypothetical protein